MSNPSIVVPEDALGLSPHGWEQSRREVYDEFGTDDVYGCHEEIEWLATGFLALTSERFRPPSDGPARWMDVVYVDYGSTDLLSERLSGFADVEASCEGETVAHAWAPPAVPAGFETFGFSRGTVTTWVVSDSVRRAVIFNSDDVSFQQAEVLSDGAARFLSEIEDLQLG